MERLLRFVEPPVIGDWRMAQRLVRRSIRDPFATHDYCSPCARWYPCYESILLLEAEGVELDLRWLPFYVGGVPYCPVHGCPLRTRPRSAVNKRRWVRVNGVRV